MNEDQFRSVFAALTRNEGGHFPWQWELYRRFVSDRSDNIPESCTLPTGLGKTSVMAIWLIALATRPDRVPRRLVYVVNRRTVVDQSTAEAEKYRNNLAAANLTEPLRRLCAAPADPPLAISTLRGQFADNRAWSADPCRPAVICGTVDMIGSRLLFSGYGCGFKTRPLHAGFLGQDALLVHDEAHLEPAFQKLLVAIQREQHERERTGDLPWPKLRVMELSATSRGTGAAFELTAEEKTPPEKLPDPPAEPIHHVWRRLRAKKGIKFHPAKRDEIAKRIGEMARSRWKPSGQAVMVFVRTIDDVKTVHQVLTDKKEGVSADQVRVLTGTLRGLERDRLATEDEVFARFLPEPRVTPKPGTVYLVCTSAGEVGVDISADHMVCDLTTLDSMAQRLGRVNRRGSGAAEIDVLYETDPDPKKKEDGFERARWETKTCLEHLPKCVWIEGRLDGSPLGLQALRLSREAQKAAFAPEPTILSTSDILFDAWALTTIRGKLPGRPMVEPYLHGIDDYDPLQTTVAWRTEVELLTPEILARNKLDPEGILELYPLKPHEELSGPTFGKNKVFEQLEAIAMRDAKREPSEQLSAWVIDPDGTVTVYPLQKLIEKDKQNKPAVALGGRTIILPPSAGGLEGGLLKGDEPFTGATDYYDVSAEWYTDATRTIRRRVRVWDDDEEFEKKTEGMRLVRRIEFPAEGDDEDAAGRSWYWFSHPLSADDDGSKTAQEPIPWKRHTDHVVQNATWIADKLLRDHPILYGAVILAAKFHDLGKKRIVWQRGIGNPNPTDWYAKSGRDPKTGRLWKPFELSQYRHEFGSLVDLEDQSEFQAIADEEQKDLIRHLIAVHHGHGRPHFDSELAFDPDHGNTDDIAAAIPRRFARLQRKYGRWGLAYLESLLRAADYAASASPSSFVESDR